MSGYEGLTIWVEDREEAYLKAKFLAEEKGKLKVLVLKTREERLVSKNEVEFTHKEDEENLHLVEDLKNLPDLNKAALIESLMTRYYDDSIYTFTGDILIAVNPFKRIKGLYESKVMNKYLDSSPGDKLSPHAYGIAHNAYQSMLEYSGRNQSVLVSGESGAGKTETTKIVMNYLTHISARNSSGDSSDISQAVLQSNPLLEAFGNAKTVRNDNSSRFGKLIQMQFEPHANNPELIAAKIDTYLLEKARITHQMNNERNFHIFYELADGASSQQREHWKYPDKNGLSKFRFVNQSGTFDRRDISDKKQFKYTLEAMDKVGVSDVERERVFCIVAAILHLGNVEFDETSSTDGDGSAITSASRHHAMTCCQLLDVDIELLTKALCTRTISAGGLKGKLGAGIEKQHTVAQAAEARDALAMTLYERMFLWLVWRVNQAISVVGDTDERKKRLSEVLRNRQDRENLAAYYAKNNKNVPEYICDYSIGCLDIFGFEVFEENSFEQLCINYANEVLQQHFNDVVFKQEQNLYESEKINWENISFPDNRKCINMIEGKPIGLLKLIDEECMFPNGSDESLYKKLRDNLPRNQKFEDTFLIDAGTKQRTQANGRRFSIVHFAGEVEYTVYGFYAKNKNELRQESINLTRSSKDDLVRILIPYNAASGSAAVGKSDEYFDMMNKKKKKKKNKARFSLERHQTGTGTQKIQQTTVGGYFKKQLHRAMKHIRESEPHYVRCIKPNDENVRDSLDRARTMEQLNYSGVLEVVRVARAGYSTRFFHQEFLHRYRGLHTVSPKELRRSESKVIPTCKSVMEVANVTEGTDYAVGLTMMFLRPDAYLRLERVKNRIQARSARKIQRVYRAFDVRTRAERAKRLKEAEARRKAEAERIRKEKEAEEERKRLEEIARLEALKEEERKREEEERKRREEEERKRLEEEERKRKEEIARKEHERRVKAVIKLQSIARLLYTQRKVRELILEMERREDEDLRLLEEELEREREAKAKRKARKERKRRKREKEEALRRMEKGGQVELAAWIAIPFLFLLLINNPRILFFLIFAIASGGVTAIALLNNQNGVKPKKGGKRRSKAIKKASESHDTSDEEYSDDDLDAASVEEGVNDESGTSKPKRVRKRDKAKKALKKVNPFRKSTKNKA